MTETEIIKALECCSKNCCNYKECPYSDNELDCVETLTMDALDLINRQKAEIEKLATRNSKLKNRFTIEFDYDELKKIVQKAVDGIVIDINQAKSEAIREFAEKLKHKSTYATKIHITLLLPCRRQQHGLQRYFCY